MGKLIDETGNQYFYWTVLSREKNVNGEAMWRCQCKCGNIGVVSGSSLRSGNSKSCGCYHNEISSAALYVDLTGKRFGRLLVKEDCGRRNHKTLWKCICDCGKETYVTTNLLTSGKTQSCGCLHREIVSNNQKKKLIGRKFERLLVENEIGINSNHQMEWMCICDCGNHKIATSVELLRGRVISCGCIKSHGEQIIQSWLECHNIEFIREKRFDDCRDKRPLPFDFYLPTKGKNGACIEFDGIQHYQESRMHSIKTSLEDRIIRDEIKTKYCTDNNILLLRIPYWEKDNIESILNDWLFLNDTEEANSSDADLSA